MTFPFLTVLELGEIQVSAGTLGLTVIPNLPNFALRYRSPYDDIHAAKTAVARTRLRNARAGHLSDLTIHVDGKDFKLHKSLVDIRCPQLAGTTITGVTAAQFNHVVDFLYGDSLPEKFTDLLSLYRAAQTIKWNDLVLTIQRHIWITTNAENVWDRLVDSAANADGAFFVNWFIFYQSQKKVILDKKYKKKARRALRKAGKVVPQAGDTQKRLEEVKIWGRVEAERTQLTLQAPKLVPPKSTLRHALSQLAAGVHTDTRVFVDLEWFPLHNWIVAPQWSQFTTILKDRAFVDVPASTFRRVITYLYSGETSSFTVNDCHWILAGRAVFDNSLVNYATQVSTNALNASLKTGDKEDIFRAVAAAVSLGNNSAVSWCQTTLKDDSSSTCTGVMKSVATWEAIALHAAAQRRASHKIYVSFNK